MASSEEDWSGESAPDLLPDPEDSVMVAKDSEVEEVEEEEVLLRVPNRNLM